MSEQRTFTTEELTAYLDGEADAPLRQALDRALADDDALRDRLSGLDIKTSAIASAFDGLLPAAPPYPLAGERLPVQSATPPWRALAATAVVCLGLGWLASTLATRARTETWQHYVATYHAMYVTGTLAHVDVAPAVSAADLKRVSDVLGLALPLEAISGSDQLVFKRAQVLGFDGRSVAQLAFLAKSGAPIALCIAPTVGTPARAVRTDTVLGMAAATWTNGGHDFLLIGGTDAALIANAAAVFAKAL